jgi:biopolymer transport protein ExbD
VPHGDVMELIDLVKVAGVKRFALTVEEKTR